MNSRNIFLKYFNNFKIYLNHYVYVNPLKIEVYTYIFYIFHINKNKISIVQC